jgi:hypothetical protein
LVENQVLSQVLTQNPTQSSNDKPIVESESTILFSVNDILIFRIFKALIYLGLGIIYLFVTPTDISLLTTNSISLASVLLTILPYGLLAVGILFFIEVIYYDKKILNHLYIDILAFVVAGYYSFLALTTARNGLFIFTASMAGLALFHLISDVRNSDTKHTFVNSFTKLKLLLTTLACVILAIQPSIFPITTLIGFIEGSREFFVLLWFIFLIVPPLMILYQKDNKSIISIPYYALTSVLLVVVGVKTLMSGNYDISYFCFLTGIFGLFLTWWNQSGAILDLKKIRFIVGTFSWISVVILMSLYTLDVFRKHQEDNEADQLQLQLNDLIKSVGNKIHERDAVMTSFAGRDDFRETLKSRDPESNITFAKDIFDRLQNIDRVLIYDVNGIAVGVYPRNSLSQGANFSSREYFQKTVNLKEGYISELFQSVVGTSTVLQTEPVFENNEVIGIIGIATSPHRFSQVFEIDKLSPTRVKIVDQRGNAIAENEVSDQTDINEADLYNPVNAKKREISLSRNIGYPNWEIEISVVQGSTVSGLAPITTGLVAIILMNSIFSVIVAVASTRKKPDLVMHKNIPFDRSVTNIPIIPVPKYV